MKTLIPRFSLLTALMCTPTLSLAGNPSHESFYATGMATLSCGKILEATQNEIGRAQIADWFNGYVTSYNYFGTKNVVPPDNSTSIAFVDSYCRNNPLHNIIQAASVLVQDLGGPKARHRYKP